jgi:hypothetical protein
MSTEPVPSPTGEVSAADIALTSASAELKLVGDAIGELQSRLERANAQMNQVTAVRTTELEIGRLFMEAQRFTDSALARLEGQIQEVLNEAGARARQIVHEAEQEAEAIRQEARRTLTGPDEAAAEGSPSGAHTPTT